MTLAFRTPAGVRSTDLGPVWAVYSPLSGQTLMLNTEAVAMLEVLREQPGDLAYVCSVLAAEGQRDPIELEALCRGVWQQLLDAGLLEPATAAGNCRTAA